MEEFFTGELLPPCSTADAAAEAKKYEQLFHQSFRKEDARKSLEYYNIAVSLPQVSQEVIRSRHKMLESVLRCDESESAFAAFHSGKQLTAQEMYILGKCHCDGFMTPENKKQGMLWIWDAAAHGHTEAQYEIGNYYLSSRYSSQKSVEDGMYFLRMAAENGSVNAQCKLGHIYSRGHRHVPIDLEEAAKWYTLAAENGNTLAKSYLRRHENQITDYHSGGVLS